MYVERWRRNGECLVCVVGLLVLGRGVCEYRSLDAKVGYDFVIPLGNWMLSG